jgi:hypothetical protein
MLAVALTLTACGDDGGGSDESDGGGPTGSGDDGGSLATTGSDDGATASDDVPPATDSGDSGSGDSGSDGATDTGGPLVPVMCDGVECAPGEICVAPGVTCDYGPCSEDPPGEAEFVTPSRFCSEVPRACEADDETCLAGELCTDSIDIPPLMDGVLLCPAEAKDCFCDL